MKLHLVALPHVRLGTPTTHLCAYSAKIMKFCKMMHDKYYEILLYAPESDPVPGATLVNCLSDAQRTKTFGLDDANRLPDWPRDEQTLIFNMRAAAEILERADQKELVLLIGGLTHKPIKDVLSRMICIEPFCGYMGVMTDKIAFESYFHMAQVYQRYGYENVRWFDAPVIHPFFDPDEFPVSDALPSGTTGVTEFKTPIPPGYRNYIVYLGRLIQRKSIRLCGEIAKASGLKLKVAGSGAKEWKDGEYIIAQDGTKIEGDVEYVGPVNVEERAELLSNARATLTLTTFFEPGCNVMFESLACGTPVISTDAGIFPEIIRNGVNGFRVHSMKEAVQAVVDAANLNHAEIRAEARASYSLRATAPKFESWFNRLQTLWAEGFYAK